VKEFKIIFWDFDGVIKDSVSVKTVAFEQLFLPCGSAVAERVRQHHEANGGMSRFDKLPLYLSWGGLEATEECVNAYCEQFSQLVFQGVIDAPWVPGVEKYVRNNRHQQVFVLVSATPQEELEKILHSLDLDACFTSVYGAPMSKGEAIQRTLSFYDMDPERCLMIGDDKADLDAALVNHVPFLLRRHDTNGIVFKDYSGDSVEDFINQ